MRCMECNRMQRKKGLCEGKTMTSRSSVRLVWVWEKRKHWMEKEKKNIEREKGLPKDIDSAATPPLNASIRTGQTRTSLCVSSVMISTSIGDQHADGEGSTCKAARGVRNVRIRPFQSRPIHSVLFSVLSSVLSPPQSPTWSCPFSTFPNNGGRNGIQLWTAHASGVTQDRHSLKT